MNLYRSDLQRVWGESFCTCPNWPWSPPSLLYNGFRVSFLGVKQPGCDIDYRPSSSAEVKERVVTPLLPLWSFTASSRLKFVLPFSINPFKHSGFYSLPLVLTLKKTSFFVRLYYCFSHDSYSYNGCSPKHH